MSAKKNKTKEPETLSSLYSDNQPLESDLEPDLMEEMIRRRRLVDAQIPPRYMEKTLDNFEARSKALKDVKNAAESYIQTFSKSAKGIYIYGCTGCGKSHIASSILKAVIEKNFSGFWINTTDLLNSIYDNMNSYRINEELEYYEMRARNTELLVLDDLGAESPRGSALERLYSIVNTRYEANKPIIVTSNLQLLELSESLQDKSRILSRLGEICVRFQPFPNEDYRLKKMF